MYKGSFISYGFLYSGVEAALAREIRDMPDSEDRNLLIQCFEAETGKRFLFQPPVKIAFNMCTALMSSLEIERGAAQVELDRIRPRIRSFESLF